MIDQSAHSLITNSGVATTRRLSLPARLRLLLVTPLGERGDWLADVFASDCSCRVTICQAHGQAESLARLREETFDAVLLMHRPPRLDALQLIEALRVGGHDDAAVILGNDAVVDLESPAWEAGANAYCCIATTTARSLLWNCARAIAEQAQRAELTKIQQNHRQRLAVEHAEAERLLADQRSLVTELESLGVASEVIGAAGIDADTDTAELLPSYSDLLRSHIMMSGGSPAGELSDLVATLVVRHISARSAMRLHVAALQQLVAGLGGRSARHVVSRADLLLVELLTHLADTYRERYNHDQSEHGRSSPVASTRAA